MTAITFDTLKFVERLKHSGISDKQAKAFSEAFREAQWEMDIATKHDLKVLAYQLTIRLGGMLAAAVAIIVALQKIL